MSELKPQATEKLKKTLNLPLLIFYGVGTILGLGIYVLLGKVGGEAGMLAPFAFLVAAILAGFTGLSYGELASRIPKSAGEVNYVDEAFGKKFLSMAMGWLIVLSAMVSTATVVNGYVGYVHVFIELPDWLIMIAITIMLGAVAAKGISESAFLITVITIIEIAGLFLVIFIAGDNLVSFSARWEELIPSATTTDWEKILLGAFLAFFTFIGFQDMVNVAEEAKNPKKDMPTAIMVSLVVLTVLYIIVAVIAGLGLTPQELNQSEAPLADILAKEGENYPKIISAIGLIAIVNGVLVQIVMSARVMYGMAEKKMAPSLFGKVNSTTNTPIWSTIFATVFILLLSLSFDLKNLAIATNYILILVFILINLALIAIKRKVPHPEGIKTYPIAIPILGAIFSLGILIFQAWSSISGI
ncbi:APC family permease [Cyclobacterium salsum]|uniref:APC family permease n=1 Tax=Cyclobacterium salsum TaxID=2666329 RepID=UPI00139112F1|nr:amino acid permease [Cyclobacterium salsum]